MINLFGDLDSDGEYRALLSMYEGEIETRGLDASARIRKREGRAAQVAGILEGIKGFGD